jgi:ABC-type branched-subunit amino acid transport system substrate-binding protein
MGQGTMPQAQADKLATIVKNAHENGIRLRFWAIPQSESIWQTLNDAGVDLLNADDLGKLQALLLQNFRLSPKA